MIVTCCGVGRKSNKHIQNDCILAYTMGFPVVNDVACVKVQAGASKWLQKAFWRPSGATLRAGASKWPQNAFWRRSGATLQLGLQSDSRRSSGGLLELLCGLGLAYMGDVA